MRRFTDKDEIIKYFIESSMLVFLDSTTIHLNNVWAYAEFLILITQVISWWYLENNLIQDLILIKYLIGYCYAIPQI